MHISISKNFQLITEKLYYLMSFVSIINLKIIILMDNYASYYINNFLKLDKFSKS